MAWDGTGTYNRPVTTVSPATNDTTIDPDDQNTYTTDVTTAINACLAKNGENAATGNLDIGGFKLTDVADGTVATDAATYGQLLAADVDVGFEASANSGAIQTSWSQVSYPTEDRDPGSNFASSYYTCPTDGVYQFNAQTTVGLLDAGKYLSIALYVDTGSGDAVWLVGEYNINNNVGTKLTVAQVSAMGKFSAGDKVSVYAIQDEASAADCLTTSGYNHFNGTRLNLG